MKNTRRRTSEFGLVGPWWASLYASQVPTPCTLFHIALLYDADRRTHVYGSTWWQPPPMMRRKTPFQRFADRLLDGHDESCLVQVPHECTAISRSHNFIVCAGIRPIPRRGPDPRLWQDWWRLACWPTHFWISTHSIYQRFNVQK